MSRGVLAVAVVSVFVFVACGDQAQVGQQSQSLTSPDCVVTGNLNKKKFPAAVAENGDTLKQFYPDAGLAIVTTDDCSAYSKYGTAVVDLTIQWITPEKRVAFNSKSPAPAPEVLQFDDDFYFFYQWGHTAVKATEAWAKGVRGAGVKVAVLDTGFDYYHKDLYANVDFANSIDFTGEGLLWGPGLNCDQYTIPDDCNDPDTDCQWDGAPATGTCRPGLFSHGTHTAGTVAAADNAFGSIGVAPDAKLILVKVLGDNGRGSFADVAAGMVHAADAGAKVISMSLGGYAPQAYAAVMSHVVNYCRAQGAVIVAAAGNDALDLDHIQKMVIPDYFGPGLDLDFDNGSYVHIPSGVAGVLSIAATAPVGWGYNTDTNLDVPASYSNYGQSSVDFAAPGGDYQLYPTPGYHYDMVFSTGAMTYEGGTWWYNWYWGAGTSMATPHAAGIAALIISEGGNTIPALVEAKMMMRAADLGQPGNDDHFGMGRVESGY